MKKMKTSVKIIFGAFIFLFLSNIPPIQTIFKFFFDQNIYYYSPGDGRWIFDENVFKGRVFNFRTVTSQEYRDVNPGADTLIYRNFKENPIAFWRYRDYIFDKRYTLPYMPFDEARKKRQEWKQKMSSEGRAY